MHHLRNPNSNFSKENKKLGFFYVYSFKGRRERMGGIDSKQRERKKERKTERKKKVSQERKVYMV